MGTLKYHQYHPSQITLYLILFARDEGSYNEVSSALERHAAAFD